MQQTTQIAFLALQSYNVHRDRSDIESHEKSNMFSSEY